MLQSLAGHLDGRVHLEVLRQGTSTVEHLALQVGLDACRNAEFRSVFVVPCHGKVVVEVERVGACLDGEVVRVVVDVDTVAVARADERQVGGESVREDVAPSQRRTAVAVAQTNHLLHVELVVTVVKGEEQAVVFAEHLRHLRIDVVEVDL